MTEDDSMRFIYFVGTAGSGKSTLVNAYKQWLEENNMDPLVVNLDPGADSTPYAPDVDVRDWISLGDVMDEFELGPNGAQVAAADLLAVNIGRLRDAITGSGSKYVLVDTPGQLELFAFRQSSIDIVDALGRDKSLAVYTADPMLYRTANGFVSGQMLSMLVQFRLQIPTINILTKADMLDEEHRDRLIGWFENPDELYGALLDEDRDSQSIAGMELFRALENTGVFGQMRAVSAKGHEGLEEIYAATQLAFFGGEDPDVDEEREQ